MKSAAPPHIRSGLAGLAALLTAASALAAGVTATGLALRVGVAAAGFWALGAVVERVCVLCRADQPEPPRSGRSAVGRSLSVTIPAAGPDPAEGAGEEGSVAGEEGPAAEERPVAVGPVAREGR